jgi:tRNA(Phe) wybutosine-synthesizing methylase Tyw3
MAYRKIRADIIFTSSCRGRASVKSSRAGVKGRSAYSS